MLVIERRMFIEKVSFFKFCEKNFEVSNLKTLNSIVKNYKIIFCNFKVKANLNKKLPYLE